MKPTSEILERIEKCSSEHKDGVFTRLYRYLLREDIYYAAYQKLYANKGATTQGIDDDTADGFSDFYIKELIQSLKDGTYKAILILSTSSALADKLQAFKTGADDYLTKPFETEECLARVYALLRRFHELNPLKTRAYSIVAHGDLMMKRDTRQALISGRPLELTYREYELLNLFMSHPERVFTFEQLYEQVWAEPYMGNKNSVVCEMKRLRKKLGDTDPIEAVREVGYRFKKE